MILSVLDLFPGTLGSVLQNWIVPSSLVIGVHVFLIGIIYMIYKLTGSRELRGVVVSESSAIMGSVLVVVVLFLLSSTLSPIISSYISYLNGDLPKYYYNSFDFRWHKYESTLPTPDKGVNYGVLPSSSVCAVMVGGPSDSSVYNCDNLILIARMYFGVLYERLADFLSNINLAYYSLTTLDTTGIGANTGIGHGLYYVNIYSSPTINGVSTMILQNMQSTVQKIMFIDKFLETVLLFFDGGLGGFLIGFGMFMRAIPMFRRAGAQFIALGIAFMYIFPALMALSWVVAPVDEATPDAIFDEGILSSNSALVSSDDLKVYLGLMGASVVSLLGLTAAAVSSGVNMAMGAVYLSFAGYYAASTAMLLNSIPSSVNLFTIFDEGIVGSIDVLARFYLVAIGIPLFNLYITFSFIKGISKFAGGYFELPGISRLI